MFQFSRQISNPNFTNFSQFYTQNNPTPIKSNKLPANEFIPEGAVYSYNGDTNPLIQEIEKINKIYKINNIEISPNQTNLFGLSLPLYSPIKKNTFFNKKLLKTGNGTYIYVNAKQYDRIKKRREMRDKQKIEMSYNKGYKFESRHKHACTRIRGKTGKFLSNREIKNNKEFKEDKMKYNNNLIIKSSKDIIEDPEGEVETTTGKI